MIRKLHETKKLCRLKLLLTLINDKASGRITLGEKSYNLVSNYYAKVQGIDIYVVKIVSYNCNCIIVQQQR